MSDSARFSRGRAKQEVYHTATGQNPCSDECFNRTLKHDIDQRPARNAEKNQRRDRVKGDSEGAPQTRFSPAQYKESQNSGEGIERHGGAGEDKNLLERGAPEK